MSVLRPIRKLGASGSLHRWLEKSPSLHLNVCSKNVTDSNASSKIIEGFEAKEETRPNQYREARCKAISALKKFGPHPYPHQFNRTMNISEFIDRYQHLAAGDQHVDIVSVAGRIQSKRECDGGRVCYKLTGGGTKLAVVADQRELDDANFDVNRILCKGDIVDVTGSPEMTNEGQLKIASKKLALLAPCLHVMPDGLVDTEKRYKQRYLDLILNSRLRETFHIRTKVISSIRQFFQSLGFLEVETPMMNSIAGGAAAIPFVTHHNHLNTNICMRVAPELYLKMLVIGGIERVFEIGKQLRNEGIDRTHSTEFTTCEFYMAYADYNDLIQITERLISGLVKEIHGSFKIKHNLMGNPDKVVELDFTPPFRRVSMIEELQRQLGVTFPPPMSFASSEFRNFLDDLCLKYSIDCGHPRTASRLLDKLVKNFVEVQCINPTFIMDHPEIMSPLSKEHRSKPGLTERFELFVCRTEVADAYTDLNDPFVTRERFEQQMQDRAMGDEEAYASDDDFFKALEYGLPPCAGWGLGIDRLCMFLTNSPNIQEVMCFPTV